MQVSLVVFDICRYVPYFIISYTQHFKRSICFSDRRFALIMETVCAGSVNVTPDTGAQFANAVRYVLQNVINYIP